MQYRSTQLTLVMIIWNDPYGVPFNTAYPNDDKPWSNHSSTQLTLVTISYGAICMEYRSTQPYSTDEPWSHPKVVAFYITLFLG